jgi:hypothetical protein
MHSTIRVPSPDVGSCFFLDSDSRSVLPANVYFRIPISGLPSPRFYIGRFLRLREYVRMYRWKIDRPQWTAAIIHCLCKNTWAWFIYVHTWLVKLGTYVGKLGIKSCCNKLWHILQATYMRCTGTHFCFLGLSPCISQRHIPCNRWSAHVSAQSITAPHPRKN